MNAILDPTSNHAIYTKTQFLMLTSIPPSILAAISQGKAILFLGAGASFDAVESGNKKRNTSAGVVEALKEETK